MWFILSTWNKKQIGQDLIGKNLKVSLETAALEGEGKALVILFIFLWCIYTTSVAKCPQGELQAGSGVFWECGESRDVPRALGRNQEGADW